MTGPQDEVKEWLVGLPGDGGQLEGTGETLVALGVVVLQGHLGMGKQHSNTVISSR